MRFKKRFGRRRFRGSRRFGSRKSRGLRGFKRFRGTKRLNHAVMSRGGYRMS